MLSLDGSRAVDRYQRAAVWRQGYAGDVTQTGGYRDGRSGRGCVPDRGAVLVKDSDPPSVSGELDGLEISRGAMAKQAETCAGLGIPETDAAAFRREG